MPAEACNRVKPGLNKTVLYHVSNFLDSRNRQNLQTPTQQSSLWSRSRMKRAVKPSFGTLFLRWHAVPGQFAFSALADARLFAQGFSTNTILAGFADTAFEYRCRLTANHAFLFFVAHQPAFYLNRTNCQHPSSITLSCDGFSRIISNPY